MGAVIGPLLGGIAAGGIGALSSSSAADKATRAQQQALALQLGQQEQNFQRGAQASSDLLDPTERAGGRSLEELARGFAQQRGAIQAGGQAQLGDIGRSAQQQLGFLSRGLGGAEQALAPALGLRSRVEGPSQLEQLIADPSAITKSPAFQFRQRQGEEALGRSAAARGGRASGRSLKALQEFSQGLASTELDAAARRAGQVDAGNRQLAGIGFGSGSQLAGLASQFGQQAGGVANQTGALRRGVLGATTDALGQSFAGQGQAVGDQIGVNQQALNNLSLAPFGLNPAPGTGANFQAGTQGAGTGSAQLANAFGNIAKAGIEAGFSNIKGATATPDNPAAGVDPQVLSDTGGF